MLSAFVYVQRARLRLSFFDEDDTETAPLLGTGQQQVEVTKRAHVIKAAFYAVQNFYAFMLM
jgi:hypothetical protein